MTRRTSKTLLLVFGIALLAVGGITMLISEGGLSAFSPDYTSIYISGGIAIAGVVMTIAAWVLHARRDAP